MKINNLPLQDLFNKLRESGFILGVDDYELLLQALMSGFGISQKHPLESLARVCKLLWVKSPQEIATFDHYFDLIMSQDIFRETVIIDEPIAEQPAKPEPISSPSPSPENLEPRFSESQVINPELDSPNPPPEEDLSQDRDPDEDTIPDLTLNINDEVQVAKTKQSQNTYWEASHHKESHDQPHETNNYLLYSDYLPITAREMKQNWRYLRRLRREGAATELDVKATVKQVAQEGFFFSPVLVPQRINRVELIFLLDIDGSMVPFHSLGERLQETAIRGGRLGRSHLYYFHNCPVDYLYSDSEQREAERLEDLLPQLSHSHSCLLIFSDAGAARGGYSKNRLERTEWVLQQFQQRLRYLAWLNPVPSSRWRNTTAEEIAKLVPMFQCNRSGLQNAIKVLKGHFMV